MGTGITLLIVAVLTIAVTRSLIKRKKSGKPIGCGGDCSNCIQGCDKRSTS